MSEELAIIRPARRADLEHFDTFSHEAGPGITSLPRDKTLLEKRLEESERAFLSAVLTPHKETYLFALEIGGEVVGTSGLFSRIGMEEPFHAFHTIPETFSSTHLELKREVPVLHLIQASNKPTEVGTLYIKRAFRGKKLGPLLSLSRFLFIATFLERFAPVVIAEMRGYNEKGFSPFWESVGAPFFGASFSEADHLRLSHPEVIEELFPRHPIYTILLPQEAQEVIGVPHPNTVPALKMLERQGFRKSAYVDIFDGGPHVYAKTDQIDTVKNSREAVVRELRHELRSEQTALVCNQELDFRACHSSLLIEEGRVTLPASVGSALNIDIGDTIRYYLIAGD